jgi:hypothetical protein
MAPRQTTIYKTVHKELKIEKHEHHTLGMNPCTPAALPYSKFALLGIAM